MRYCHFGVSLVNFSDSDSEQMAKTFSPNFFGANRDQCFPSQKRRYWKQYASLMTDLPFALKPDCSDS